MQEVRCPNCNKLLFKAIGHFQISIKCSRCKAINNFKKERDKHYDWRKNLRWVCAEFKRALSLLFLIKKNQKIN